MIYLYNFAYSFLSQKVSAKESSQCTITLSLICLKTCSSQPECSFPRLANSVWQITPSQKPPTPNSCHLEYPFHSPPLYILPQSSTKLCLSLNCSTVILGQNNLFLKWYGNIIWIIQTKWDTGVFFLDIGFLKMFISLYTNITQFQLEQFWSGTVYYTYFYSLLYSHLVDTW